MPTNVKPTAQSIKTGNGQLNDGWLRDYLVFEEAASRLARWPGFESLEGGLPPLSKVEKYL